MGAARLHSVVGWLAEEALLRRGGHLARTVATLVIGVGSLLGAAGVSAVAASAARASDVTGSITLDGTPVTVTITSAGQNGRYTFAGTAGQRVAVGLSASTFGPDCPAVQLSLLRPDGTQLGLPAGTCSATGFLDPQTLDQSGTWSVLVAPQNTDVGSATLRAWDVPADQTAPLLRQGTAIAINLATPGQNGRFTFTGTVGQAISVLLTGSTFSPGCPSVLVTLLRPDLTQAGSVSTCATTAFLDAVTVDQPGTWTVLVDPQAAATGTATLQGFNADDQRGLIKLDGTPVGVSTSTIGQNARFHFSGTIGQKISAEVTSAAFAGCPAFLLSLVRPDGTTLGVPASSCGASAYLDGLTLDQTGTWDVLIDPQAQATGTATLQAWDASDQVKAVNLNGASLGVNLTAPGQNGSYTFSATAGQKVSAVVSNSTFVGCPAYQFSLVRPDGTVLATALNGCGANTFFDGQSLDQTGTWAIRIDPQGTTTGTATLNAYDATDQTRGINLNGPAVAVTITRPGQNGRLTFNGSVGQSVSAQLTGATITGTCPTYAFSLLRPDGTVFGSPVTSCTATATLPPQSLDQSGTWTFLVDPQGTATGSATVQAVMISDDIRPITLNGPGLNFNLNAGQDGVYTFSGTAGQQVSVQVANSTFPGCPGYVLTLTRPDGTVLGSGLNGCGTSAFLDSRTLDQTGTWEFVVQPQGAAGTGSMQAYTFSDLTSPADLTGKPLKLVFAQPGQNARLSFTGAVGQRISAYLTASNLTGAGCPAVVLSLVRPDGSTLGSPVSTCTVTAFLDAQTLDEAGTWTVVIDPQGANSGTLTVRVYKVVDAVRAISPTGTLDSFTALQPGANGRYHFAGTATQTRRVTISYSTFSGCPAIVVSLVRPNGTTFSTNSTCNANLVLGPNVLDTTGTWTVFVDPQGPTTGTLVIKLTS